MSSLLRLIRIHGNTIRSAPVRAVLALATALLFAVAAHGGKWQIQPAAASETPIGAGPPVVASVPVSMAAPEPLRPRELLAVPITASPQLTPISTSAVTSEPIVGVPLWEPIALASIEDRHEHIADAVAFESVAAEFSPDVARWLPLIAELWPQEEQPRALCVLRGESNGDPEAHNTAPTEAAGGSVGLFQVALENVAGENRVAGLEDEPRRSRRQALALLLDPLENIRIAAAMWHAEGWLPAWAAQKRACALTA